MSSSRSRRSAKEKQAYDDLMNALRVTDGERVNGKTLMEKTFKLAQEVGLDISSAFTELLAKDDSSPSALSEMYRLVKQHDDWGVTQAPDVVKGIIKGVEKYHNKYETYPSYPMMQSIKKVLLDIHQMFQLQTIYSGEDLFKYFPDLQYLLLTPRSNANAMVRANYVNSDDNSTLLSKLVELMDLKVSESFLLKVLRSLIAAGLYPIIALQYISLRDYPPATILNIYQVLKGPKLDTLEKAVLVVEALVAGVYAFDEIYGTIPKEPIMTNMKHIIVDIHKQFSLPKIVSQFEENVSFIKHFGDLPLHLIPSTEKDKIFKTFPMLRAQSDKDRQAMLSHLLMIVLHNEKRLTTDTEKIMIEVHQSVNEVLCEKQYNKIMLDYRTEQNNDARGLLVVRENKRYNIHIEIVPRITQDAINNLLNVRQGDINDIRLTIEKQNVIKECSYNLASQKQYYKFPIKQLHVKTITDFVLHLTKEMYLFDFVLPKTVTVPPYDAVFWTYMLNIPKTKRRQLIRSLLPDFESNSNNVQNSINSASARNASTLTSFKQNSYNTRREREHLFNQLYDLWKVFLMKKKHVMYLVFNKTPGQRSMKWSQVDFVVKLKARMIEYHFRPDDLDYVDYAISNSSSFVSSSLNKQERYVIQVRWTPKSMDIVECKPSDCKYMDAIDMLMNVTRFFELNDLSEQSRGALGELLPVFDEIREVYTELSAKYRTPRS